MRRLNVFGEIFELNRDDGYVFKIINKCLVWKKNHLLYFDIEKWWHMKKNLQYYYKFIQKTFIGLPDFDFPKISIMVYLALISVIKKKKKVTWSFFIVESYDL